MLLNASPLGKAVLNGSAGGAVQSLAASASCSCSSTASPLNVDKPLGAVASVASLYVGAITNISPIASSVSVDSSASGGIVDVIPLGSAVVVSSYATGAIFDTIPIATIAGTASVSNIITANTSVAYSVDGSASSTSSTSANARVNWVVEGNASSSSYGIGYSKVDYIIAGSAVSSSSVVGDIPLTINLLAGRGGETLGETVLNGFTLNGGSSFVTSGSKMSGTIIIIFAASASVGCTAVSTGGITNTIPLGATENVVSNIAAGDLGLTVNLSGAIASTSSTSSEINLIKPFDSAISVVAVGNANVMLVKGFGGAVVVSTAPINAITSVAYVVASSASVGSALSADVNLVKPIGGSSSASVYAAPARTSVAYIVSGNSIVQTASSASLHKTDNLSDMEGTGAVSNIAYANIMLRKPLGGGGLVVIAMNANVVSAHTVDSDIAYSAYMELLVGSIGFDATVGNVFAEVTDVSYAISEIENVT